MCLEIKKGQKPRKAEKDIVVWKIVDEGDGYDPYQTKWVSPYFEANIYVGEEMRSEIDTNLNNDRLIEEAFHSYKRKKDALFWTEYWPMCRLARCIIPEGSLYYSGIAQVSKSSYENFPGYASDKIKYLKIYE